MSWNNPILFLYLSVFVCPSGHRCNNAEQAELSAQTQHKLPPPKKQPWDSIWHSTLCWSGLLRNKRWERLTCYTQTILHHYMNTQISKMDKWYCVYFVGYLLKLFMVQSIFITNCWPLVYVDACNSMCGCACVCMSIPQASWRKTETLYMVTSFSWFIPLRTSSSNKSFRLMLLW